MDSEKFGFFISYDSIVYLLEWTQKFCLKYHFFAKPGIIDWTKNNAV